MTLAWLADPTDPRVKAALTRWCAICRTRKEPCRNTIRPGEPLPGRVVHIERATRMTDVDREPVEKDGS